jgi:hypothetical protein
MNPPPDELRDALLRRHLPPAERAAAERHGDAADAALGRALAGLPDRSVASNFNARVLAALDREAAPRAPLAGWRLPWPRRAAAGGVLAAVVGLAFVGWQQQARRAQADALRPIAALGTLPQLSPEVLQDFDAIRSFAEAPAAGVDFELLESFQ